MKGNLLNRKALVVACSAVLLAGISMAAYANQPQNKKKKNEQLAQKQQNKSQNAQLARQRQNPDKMKHEQRLTVYRQYLDQQQQLHKQYMAQLQREKRMAQYRYLQLYSAQMLQQKKRYENARNLNYQNDPFYRTAFDRRYNRGGTYYETNQYGVTQLEQAIQYGYSEGFRAGTADRQDRWRSDYNRSVVYQESLYGYNGYYVDKDDYRHYFREGFRRGYQDGYNGRYQYGILSNGRSTILGSVLGGIINFEMLR
jgi:hypothetical protein